MKHVIGMMKPHQDSQRVKDPKAELDYLRLLYAVSQIRQRGEAAKGYFVVTSDDALNRLSQLEHEYGGKEYAEVVSASPEGYLRHGAKGGKTEILSGLVRDAILDKGDSRSAASIQRRMREFILAETILGYEPDARQVKDVNRFPFRIRWDYYGVVENKDDLPSRLADAPESLVPERDKGKQTARSTEI